MIHHARKRFGQNFLHDQSVINNILSSINIQKNDHIVEIGPGKGALTIPLSKEISKKTGHLNIIELDRDLIPILEKQLKTQDELNIHNTDALDFDFCTLCDNGAHENKTRLRIVGNLPYNISTPLVFHLLEQIQCIKDMHFMLQKEVVDRLAASPGTSDYGRLSVMVQYRCAVEHLFTVGPQAFTPVPKVESAIVRLTPYQQPPIKADDEKVLEKLVKQAFSQRRKTVRNTLKSLMNEEEIRSAGIDPGLRAERLTQKDFVTLSNLVTQSEKNSNS